jgi:hypothetical protein
MSENRRKILDMLAEGKITADDAERLLAALDKEPSASAANLPGGGRPRAGTAPKYLRVEVDDAEDSAKPTKVNIRVPFQLLRAGVKLQSLLPPEVRARVNTALGEKGIGFDVNQITAENVDEFIEAFSEMTIDIDADGGLTKVKVFCE